MFDAAKLITEADLVAAGKLGFEGPTDSYYNAARRFRDMEWCEKPTLTAHEIVSGRSYVVRKKGVVEAAGSTCAGCHSRVMPDGTLWNGPQISVPAERDMAWTIRGQGNKEAPAALLRTL